MGGQTVTLQHNRLASETAEEMETRLQQMSDLQHDRLASWRGRPGEAAVNECSIQRDRRESETAEDREARLQEMSVLQCDKLASETVEDREFSYCIAEIEFGSCKWYIMADMLEQHSV